MRRAALLASLAFASCSSGFGASITIDPGCVTQGDDATFSIAVRLDPSGGSAVQTISSDDFFTGDERRIVVVPPDGTTTITVTVDALGAAGSLASGSATIAVDGHQLAAATITLSGCGGADLGIADLAGRDQSGGADLAPMCTMDPDCANIPNAPICDTQTGTCVQCLLDKSCPPGQVCKQKACVTGCDQNHGCAGNVICNLDAGLCACQTSQDCGGGSQGCCNGVCVDTSSDPKHCGGCGINCNGKTCCSSTCTDTSVDVNNCGSCGTSCSGRPNTTGGTCMQSTCALNCKGGYGDCNMAPGDGCEVNTLTDPGNCGGCGKACKLMNTDQDFCSGGTCAISTCSVGWMDCNGLAVDGCEVATDSDPANCGSCGYNCKRAHVQSSVCQNSQCINTCAMPYMDCNGDTSDGCEDNTGNDPNHCGGCGFMSNCTNALPNTNSDGCAGGVCSIGNCNTDWSDCDGMVKDGCEVNTQFDSSNCGQCNYDCSNHLPPQTTSANCQSGQCHPLTCAANYGDCDGNNVNGCEDHLDTDPMNCGSCGHDCNNGMMMMMMMGGNLHVTLWGCGNSACTVKVCDAGYLDCDGLGTNGCEVNENYDAFHCGGCNTACGMGHYCSGGACTNSVTCPEPACGVYKDPISNDPFTTCGMGACPGNGSPRLSSTAVMGQGTYHVDYICQMFGFKQANTEWNDCMPCSDCFNNNGGCGNPTMGANLGANCMPDGNTTVCTGQTSWNCK